MSANSRRQWGTGRLACSMGLRKVRHNLAIEWQQLKDLGTVPGTGGENCIEKPARILPWWESQCSGRDRKWWLIQKYINNIGDPLVLRFPITIEFNLIRWVRFNEKVMFTLTLKGESDFGLQRRQRILGRGSSLIDKAVGWKSMTSEQRSRMWDKKKKRWGKSHWCRKLRTS